MSAAELITPLPPFAAPLYARNPDRLTNREYFVIAYESDPEAIREVLPEPLVPDASNSVLYEFVRSPDGTGLGEWTQAAIVIPARLSGEPVNFTSQIYLDDEPPASARRETLGIPKKFAHPRLKLHEDTAMATLHYAGRLVAVASLTCGIQRSPGIIEATAHAMMKTRCNLKMIPGPDGHLALCQLVAYNMSDISIRECWTSEARLELIPAPGAPVAHLPVKRVLGGTYYVADLTLSGVRVAFDYLEKDAE